MRRKDREMGREFGLSIIDKAPFGVLSMVDAGKPYGIPLSIVRAGNSLYFHSAPEGRKSKILRENGEVSIVFVGDWNVPELFTDDDLASIQDNEEKKAALLSGVFTVEFESAVVTGRAQLVQEEANRVEAMRLICEKYTPTKMTYFAEAAAAGLPRADIYQVEMEEIKAKRKKYDEHGVEMKWGRLE